MRNELIAGSIWTALGLTAASAGLDAAEVHVVPARGNDSNPGTRAEPFRTLRHAVTVINPGDTVVLHEGTYPVPPEPNAQDGEGREQFDRGSFELRRSGTAERAITFRAGEGENVVISTRGNGFTLDPELNLSGFVFDGLELADCAVNSFTAKADHVTVRNCILHGSGMALKNNDRARRHHHLLIENCTICNFRGIPLFPDNVDKCVIRQNVLVDSGSVSMDPGGVSDLVIENNFVVNTGHRVGALKLRWGNVEPLSGPNCNGTIVRRNVFVNGHKYVVLLASANGAMVYHNTLCYLSADPMRRGVIYMQRDPVDIAPGRPYGPNKNNVVKNNILYHAARPNVLGAWGTNSLISMNRDMTVDFDDQQIDGNLYYARYDVPYITMGPTTIDCGHLRGWGAGYDTHSLVGVEPGFVDARPVAGPEGFAVRATSPCVDAGLVLTRARGGGRGRTLPVTDARYFTDGCDMIPGDRIVIADGPPVRVLDRDITTNVLTLDREVRWSDGDPVGLPYGGSGPDIGAYEHGMDLRIGQAVGRERISADRTEEGP